MENKHLPFLLVNMSVVQANKTYSKNLHFVFNKNKESMQKYKNKKQTKKITKIHIEQ